MQQLSLQINNLPIQAIFLSNGQIGFSRLGDFNAIIDTSPDGDIVAVLTNENVKIGSKEFSYNTAYDVSATMRKWLTSQNMIYPL